MITKYNLYKESLLNKIEGPTHDEFMSSIIKTYGDNYLYQFGYNRKLIEYNLIDDVLENIDKTNYDETYVFNILRTTFEYNNGEAMRNAIIKKVGDYSEEYLNKIIEYIFQYYSSELRYCKVDISEYQNLFDIIDMKVRKLM